MPATSWWSPRIIPVGLAKQYVYCPAIPWIIQTTGYREPPTPSMETGKLDAAFKESIAKRLGLPKPWRIEIELQDGKLGLRGMVDIVAGQSPFKVVEVKRYYRRSGRERHFRAQLMVYALLVSRTLGPVDEAILVLGGKTSVYTVTREDLRSAEQIVEETRRILTREEPPKPFASEAKCNYCWYRRFCPSLM